MQQTHAMLVGVCHRNLTWARNPSGFRLMNWMLMSRFELQLQIREHLTIKRHVNLLAASGFIQSGSSIRRATSIAPSRVRAFKRSTGGGVGADESQVGEIIYQHRFIYHQRSPTSRAREAQLGEGKFRHPWRECEGAS